jgi:hypothetical protein
MGTRLAAACDSVSCVVVGHQPTRLAPSSALGFASLRLRSFNEPLDAEPEAPVHRELIGRPFCEELLLTAFAASLKLHDHFVDRSAAMYPLRVLEFVPPKGYDPGSPMVRGGKGPAGKPHRCVPVEEVRYTMPPTKETDNPYI